MKQRKGLAGDVLALLVDTGRGLTLGQIQHYLPGHYELSELSATLARLERQGAVRAYRRQGPPHGEAVQLGGHGRRCGGVLIFVVCWCEPVASPGSRLSGGQPCH
jgi:hypothetical protein